MSTSVIKKWHFRKHVQRKEYINISLAKVKRFRRTDYWKQGVPNQSPDLMISLHILTVLNCGAPYIFNASWQPSQFSNSYLIFPICDRKDLKKKSLLRKFLLFPKIPPLMAEKWWFYYITVHNFGAP